MVKLIALLKRKPSYTREEFERRWLDEHTKISAKMPGLLGYRINIAGPRQPEGTGDEPIYDGTAELWWESIDAMEAAFNSEIGVAAGADADTFCDVRIHIYTDEHDVVPGPNPPARKRAPAKRTAKKAAKKGAKRPAKKAARRSR